MAQAGRQHDEGASCHRGGPQQPKGRQRSGVQGETNARQRREVHLELRHASLTGFFPERRRRCRYHSEQGERGDGVVHGEGGRHQVSHQDQPGRNGQQAQPAPRCEATERRPYLGDSVLFDYVRSLAGGEQPLVQIEGDGQRFGERIVALTEMGRCVLVGAVGNLALNPIDRWIGGVHLTTPPAWRYDERRETIVPG